MKLWQSLYKQILELRPACSRGKTFLWLCVILMSMMMRCDDHNGVTSIVRIFGLVPICYDRILDFLHSPALNLDLLLQAWLTLVLKIFPKPIIINDRLVLVGDGIKVAKEG